MSWWDKFSQNVTHMGVVIIFTTNAFAIAFGVYFFFFSGITNEVL